MINGNKIVLREKKPADAWDDYAWEADPELAELDAAPVLTMPYSRYLLDYSYELRAYYTTSHQFSVDTLDGKHIGNCSYYNLDRSRNEVELGIMIGNRDYWNKGYGADVISTLLDYVFRQVGVNRAHLKTLDWNIRAQKCFQKCGFGACGQLGRDGHTFVLMEIYREDWAKAKQSESTGQASST